MMIQGLFRPLIGHLVFMFVLAVVITGCGGSSSSDTRPSSSESKSVVAGPVTISAVFTGQSVTLDGSKSHSADGGPVSYAWAFTATPKGSKAQLQNATTAYPSFTPDIAGTYLVEMVVTDGNGHTGRDVATVIADVLVNSKIPPNTGIWRHAGSQSYCVECHDGSLVVKINGVDTVAKTKSGDHLATSNACQDCHTPLGFDKYVHFDHHEIFDTCSNCHNGVIAIGKSQYHQPTSLECNSSGCHDTDKFVKLPLLADGSYDHSSVGTVCSACHRGIVATGKIEGHVKTDQECGFCHSPKFGFFKVPNAYPDHSTITQPCTDCHDGSQQGVTGPTPAHEKILPIKINNTLIDCDLCHNVQSYTITAPFDHGVVDPAVVPCTTCHYDNNKFTLTVRSTVDDPNLKGHPDITQPAPLPPKDCYLCHNTTNFADAVVDHTQIVQDHTPCGPGCHDGSQQGITSAPTDGTHAPFDAYNEDCAVCHTSPGGTFKVVNFDHAAHDVAGTISGNPPSCATCHNGVIATGQSDNHIPTTPPDTQECSDCHDKNKYDDFTGAKVDHSTIVDNCAKCHDGNIAIDQTAGVHVPTLSNVDCSACHSTGATPDPSPFVPAPNFQHTQAQIGSMACNSCHNGSYYLSDAKHTQVKTQDKSTHIPVAANTDCFVCHKNTTITGGFTDSVFLTAVHPNYTNGCQGCHTGQYTNARSKNDAPTPPGHVPTSQDCSYCHVNTDFKDTSHFTHKGISKDCVSCHNGDYRSLNALSTQDDPNPAGHPDISTPTGGTVDCYNCHTTVGTSFANPIVDHTNLTSDCARGGCHDGATAGVPGQNAITNHISTTGMGCENCHEAGGSFKVAKFDHATLSATTTCYSCHDGKSAGVYGTDTIITDHVAVDLTKLDCDDCHNTDSFTNGYYDHVDATTGKTITDGCQSCHDGTSNVMGKTNDHVPTNLDCHFCHTTASAGFKPATFAHNADQLVNTPCYVCHSGDYPAAVTHQGANHPDTSTMTDCSDCHDTIDWYDAGHDHSTTPDNCARGGCHDGKTQGIRGMSSIQTHLPTQLDCVACHTAGGDFATNKWDHSQNTTNCNSCHGANAANQTKYNIATRQPADHFQTSEDCSKCHNTKAYVPADTYKHASGDNYPGDHYTNATTPSKNVIQSCYDCHIKKTDKDFKYLTDSRVTNYYPPNKSKVTCAACHYDNYKTGVDEHNGISNDYQCDNCHHHSITDTRW